jgi:hypothetical protein
MSDKSYPLCPVLHNYVRVYKVYSFYGIVKLPPFLISKMQQQQHFPSLSERQYIVTLYLDTRSWLRIDDG